MTRGCRRAKLLTTSTSCAWHLRYAYNADKSSRAVADDLLSPPAEMPEYPQLLLD
jgi:hypothetical protein